MPDTHADSSQPASEPEPPRNHHVCPWWIGYLLANPLRRLVENPAEILGPFVTRGSTVVDVGCGMGFHSLDLARLVGPDGRVVCVDIQQKMLDGLARRARRKVLDATIQPRLCTEENLGLGDVAGQVELVTAYNVVHETSYPRRFLRECAESLETGGRLMVVEPRGHVSKSDFARTTDLARSLPLVVETGPTVWRSHSAVFVRS